MSGERAFYVFADRAGACEALADALAALIMEALARHGRARIALSGGSSPEPAYAALASRPIDWSKVDIALVDDRWVDPASPGSNEAMIRRAFAGARGVTIHGLKTPHEHARGPGQAAAQTAYARLRPFHAVTLGMGPDAHTASWFPGSPDLPACLDLRTTATVQAVDASAAPVAAPYPWRMTLTRPAVIESPDIALLIFGEDKRELFMRALESPEAEAPIHAAVEPRAGAFHVFWAP
jgi:6-phosphogluconolactonase